MASSTVYFTSLRAKYDDSLLTKIKRLAQAAGLENIIRGKGLAAIKIHFGERGNTAFIRPLLVRPVVDAIVEAGGRPFITDSGTLYPGSRGNSVDHLNTAILNGFAYAVVGAPLVIADGIDGRDEVAVQVNLKHFKEVFIGSAIVRADSLGLACTLQTARSGGLRRRNKKHRNGNSFAQRQNVPAFRCCPGNSFT